MCQLLHNYNDIDRDEFLTCDILVFIAKDCILTLYIKSTSRPQTHNKTCKLATYLRRISMKLFPPAHYFQDPQLKMAMSQTQYGH